MARKKVNLEKLVTYDLETIVNCITGCFTDYKTQYKKEFIIFDNLDDFLSLLRFLKSLDRSGYAMISFNGVGFDNQIVEYILENGETWINNQLPIEEIISLLYNKAQWIINLPDDEKYKQLIPEFKFTIPAIDLYKQKHYDRKQKATSLKWLQFSMRYPNIEEMPIEHDTIVTKDMIPSIMEYNWNDVDSTQAFFNKIKFETELRLQLEEKYGLNLINAAEPRLAREIFGKFLCEQMDIPYSELKKMRTFRKQIKVKDIIFPYIKFNSPELNVILDSFKRLVLNPNEKMEFNYEFKYGGIETVLGLGGIHACCASGNYKREGERVIHDIDVVSFYPNLAIKNKLKPAHLGDVFLKVYEDVFEQRKSIPKSDPINYVFKIILNSTYGLSNEKNSYLYDPQFTMSITINGQLSILMLVEMLLAKIPDLQIYQENTDGITVGYDKKYTNLVKEIVKEWQNITKLDTEEAWYKQMVINDVNNYIGIYDSGKLKKKGLFETELDFHKNPSFLIVPKALERYFVYGEKFRTFIENHNNIYDFCGAVKKNSTFDLNLYKLRKVEELSIRDKDKIEAIVKENGWVEIGKYWVTKEVYDKVMELKKFNDLDAYGQWAMQSHIKFLTLEEKMLKDAHVTLRQAYTSVLSKQSVIDIQPQQKVTRFYVSKNGGKLVKDFHDKRQTKVLADWLVQPLNRITSENINDYPDIDYRFYIKEVEKIINIIEGDSQQLKLF